jgi:hypothetical protein
MQASGATAASHLVNGGSGLREKEEEAAVVLRTGDLIYLERDPGKKCLYFSNQLLQRSSSNPSSDLSQMTAGAAGESFTATPTSGNSGSLRHLAMA